MESISVSIYKRLKGYWRGNVYERLDESGRRPKNRVELATLGLKKRRFRRIKLTPKPRFLRIGSPKKLVVGLRDAYVKMMVGFANSTVFKAGFGSVGGGFGRAPLKEYDEKVIVDICKSLMKVQGELVFHDSGRIAGEMGHRR